jgi:hypothetical protein
MAPVPVLSPPADKGQLAYSVIAVMVTAEFSAGTNKSGIASIGHD